MARVHIDDLAAGMVLSAKVCDRSGRMLLPEGEEVTERHLNIFRMWGVLEVEVVGDDLGEGEKEPEIPMDPVLLAQAREEVGRLFRHNDPKHPAVRELMRICIERRGSRAA